MKNLTGRGVTKNMSKVILISGGTKGIGRAISEALLRSGYHVVAFSPSPIELKEFSETVPVVCDTSRVLTLRGDVTDESSIAEVIKKTIECFGRIDVLINNAGIVFYDECDTVDIADFRRVVEVNLIGLAALTKAVVPHMKKQGCGQIINTVSTAGRHTNARAEFYGATKYGVMGYSQGIRAELREFGIKVATVCPGITNTTAVASNELAKRDRKEVMLEADEVARVVAFIVDQPATSDIHDILITPFGSTRYHF